MNGRVAVDWRYIPSLTLGGDSIGYHWIDDDHLALYLIDVTGHGLDSALLSVTVNNVVRSGSLPGADMLRPDEVLARLNEKFQGQSHGSRFFTIWYGVYQLSVQVLRWSGGGHHPSLLFMAGSPEPTPTVSSSRPRSVPAARRGTRISARRRGRDGRR